MTQSVDTEKQINVPLFNNTKRTLENRANKYLKKNIIINSLKKLKCYKVKVKRSCGNLIFNHIL